MLGGTGRLKSNTGLVFQQKCDGDSLQLQGTASGKCGVSFAAESCGDSVGESSYKELESQVKGLESQASENSQVVKAIASLILGYGYGSYKQPAKGSLAQPPSKIGDISVDNVWDIPDDGALQMPHHLLVAAACLWLSNRVGLNIYRPNICFTPVDALWDPRASVALARLRCN
jgi:hypothetical protein